MRKLYEKLQLHREKLRSLKPDNRGAAMVIVLVAIGMVLILVSVLMSISYLNYQMKVTEKKSKESFYSAEVVMDQIHAGLEQVVSAAANDAYVVALQTYKLDSDSDRVKKFRTNYLTNLRDALQEGSADTRYDVGQKNSSYVESTGYTDTNRPYSSGLITFLDSQLQLLAYNTSTASGSTVESLVVSCALASTESSLIWSDDGITLKSVLVQYTDPDGYYSEIETDILIGFPQVSLSDVSVLPNVTNYTIISDEAIVFSTGADTTITADVYADGRDVMDATGTTVTEVQSISLENGSNVTFDSVDYIVANGDVDVDCADLTITDGSLWANGINVIGASTTSSSGSQTSSALSMDTTAYIADDLTTTDKNITVTLKGSYYGYGSTSGTYNERSAILLNSANTTLDFSGLTNLLLNGTAYVDGASYSTLADSSGDITLGTSVAMKTDQIAFLVPAECLGTDGDDTVLIGHNPMSTGTDSVYEQWITTNGKSSSYKKLNITKKVSLLGYSLSHYGIGETDYQTIFRTVGGETVCFVYLKFSSEEKAADYYADYMSKTNVKMKSYMSKYSNTITGFTGSDYQSRGALLTYSLSNNTFTILDDTLTSLKEDEKTELDTEVNQYSHSFSALCSKLTTNYSALSGTELSRSVYNNLINTDVLEALNGKVEYSSADKRALVVDNKDGSALEVGSASSYTNVELVLASGDVKIKGNFTGTIIAGGNVTVEAVTAGKITNDQNMVKNLLQATDSTGKTLISTYFKDGDQYTLDDDDESEEDYISLESVISYVNWSKQ